MECLLPEELTDWIRSAVRLEVDLGCARGKFLVEMAQAHPERSFLGIEWQPDRVARTQRKLERLELARSRVIQGEGLIAVREGLPEKSVDVLHVLFPDPWPKRRHHVRRLLRAEFFAAVRRVLKPGGRLRFRTDDRPYFEAVMELVATLPEWREIPEEAGEIFPLTEFEQRFVDEGLPIYSVVFAPNEMASS